MTEDALDGFVALRTSLLERAPLRPGLALGLALSEKLDAAISRLAASADMDVAVIAVGGYGRRELCLRSDVDLLFLHSGRPPAELLHVLLYPLWDSGLKVGHAVRTLPEAIVAAKSRLETLTALLSARLVAGSAARWSELGAALPRLMSSQLPQLRRRLSEADAARRTAEPFQLIETNLKEGRGGLRALHGSLWLLQAEAVASGEEPAAAATLLSEAAPALDTVLAARNALHATAARPQDTWQFELQPAARAWLRCEDGAWDAQLYRSLRDIDRIAERVYSGTAAAIRAPRGLRHFARRAALPAQTAETPTTSADSTVRSVFEFAGRRAHDITREARFGDAEATAIRASHSPGWSRADRDGLFALLRAGSRGHRLFEDLDQLGFVERALPEWRHVRGAPHFAQVHLHPVDTHLWRTVVEALDLAEGRTAEPWCRDVARDLGAIDDVLLAALLHDIGKGWPGDHAATGAAAAGALCRRMRLDPDLSLTVTSAIRHHLLLPTVATRRDIADARVVEDVANKVGRTRTLQVLYLLSVADSRATGPLVWSPWKASLVRTLFVAALGVLERRASASPLRGASGDRERVLAAARPEDRAQLMAHLDGMAPGYLRSYSTDQILNHVRLMAPAPGRGEIRLGAREQGPYADVTLVAPDRPGLIAVVAGVLALHNLTVLDGRFFTRADGCALQTLAVSDALARPIGSDRWDALRRDVARALDGSFALHQRLVEKRHAYRRQRRDVPMSDVRIVRDASSEYTVVEVHASDRVGLLYTIATCLFELRVDIHLAKLETQGHRVVDTFYLRELGGLPLNGAERLRELHSALLAALDG